MPARDHYHDTVRRLLINDGWTITHDPMRLFWQDKSLFLDLAAERVLAAEREHEKIAVEIKSFVDPGAVHEIHPAVGQYIFYRAVLARVEPERELYLALPRLAYELLFEESRVGAVLLEDERIRLLVFDPHAEEIVQWLIP